MRGIFAVAHVFIAGWDIFLENGWQLKQLYLVIARNEARIQATFVTPILGIIKLREQRVDAILVWNYHN